MESIHEFHSLEYKMDCLYENECVHKLFNKKQFAEYLNELYGSNVDDICWPSGFTDDEIDGIIFFNPNEDKFYSGANITHGQKEVSEPLEIQLLNVLTGEQYSMCVIPESWSGTPGCCQSFSHFSCYLYDENDCSYNRKN